MIEIYEIFMLAPMTIKVILLTGLTLIIMEVLKK